MKDYDSYNNGLQRIVAKRWPLPLSRMSAVTIMKVFSRHIESLNKIQQNLVTF